MRVMLFTWTTSGYTSGPLIHDLAKNKTYVASGYDQAVSCWVSLRLKGVKLARGEYIAKAIDGLRYFVFNDRPLVCFCYKCIS